MKICIVSDFFVPHYNGGGERRYFELAKRFVDRGHHVDVIGMKLQGVDDHEVVEGINVHHVGPVIRNPPNKTVSDFIHYVVSAFLWILKNDYDIIDSQQYAPFIIGFFGGKIKRTPVIGTIHDVSSGRDDQWLTLNKVAPFIEKFLLRLPYDKIITVSNHTKKALTKNYGVNPERIDLLYNGVDLQLVDSIIVDKKNNDSIIFVGRLAPHKHVDDLINVVKLLKEDSKDVYLKVVGNGIEKDNLIKMVNDLNLNDQVDFASDLEYSDVITEIKKSSILALPSTREGFGMVLTEANACNIPAVTYKSGGVVEVIEDSKNGFLVEPRNLDELSKKIIYLLENENIAREMGEYGRKKVENCFDWENITTNILEIYEKLIE